MNKKTDMEKTAVHKATNEVLGRLKPEDKKKGYKLFFVAGPSGSGKDGLAVTINRKMNNQCIILDMDEFRYLDPKATKKDSNGNTVMKDKDFGTQTNEFAYSVLEEIENSILEKDEYRGTNVIMTGTLKSKEWVTEDIMRFKRAGYEINIETIVMPQEENEVSLVQRYLGFITNKSGTNGGPPYRFASFEYHKESITGFLETMEYIIQNQIADNITISRRHGDEVKKILDSRIISIDINFATILQEIIESKSEIDMKDLLEICEQLEKYKDYLEKQMIYEGIFEWLKRVRNEIEQRKVQEIRQPNNCNLNKQEGRHSDTIEDSR